MLISEVKSPIILHSLRSVDASITDLSYLVPSLLIYCSSRPKLIQNDCVWSFEVKENSRLVASGSKSDIRKDGSREGILREIIDE